MFSCCFCDQLSVNSVALFLEYRLERILREQEQKPNPELRTVIGGLVTDQIVDEES